MSTDYILYRLDRKLEFYKSLDQLIEILDQMAVVYPMKDVKLEVDECEDGLEILTITFYNVIFQDGVWNLEIVS